jgi:hypothetical protein
MHTVGGNLLPPTFTYASGPYPDPPSSRGGGAERDAAVMLLHTALVLDVLLLTTTAAAASPAVVSTVVFVAPHGSDSASGLSATTPLASCAGAVRVVSALYPSSAAPAGVEVRFGAGTYTLNDDTACGTVSFKATQQRPVLFTAAEGATVIFDASSELNATRLQPVTDPTMRALLNPAARDDIRQLRLPTSTGWAAGGHLVMDGVPLRPSVWPNKGLGYIRKVFDQGASRTGWVGPPPVMPLHVCTGDEHSTHDQPCGANVSLAEQPTGNWAAEMAAGPGFGEQVKMQGYMNYDWDLLTHTINRVVQDETNTSVQFGEWDGYGICEALERTPNRTSCGGAPGRFVVHGLLSEVDSPGEFFYHAPSHTLYVYPPTPTAYSQYSGDVDGAGKGKKTSLGFWSGGDGGLITLQNASWVTVSGVSVTGANSTAISVMGGENNTIGGCTLRNCMGGVQVIGGHRNRVIGNDIYDIAATHIITRGETAEGLQHSTALGEMIPTNNLVANNHLTQVYLDAGRLKWTVASLGMGDRFCGNLLHDSPGQLINPGGPLSLWDRNEIFNTGYSEGDGGVMYAGACLTRGFGMHIRHNFVHHSLDVPGLTVRGGLYFDDHFMSASNVSNNVLYKAAGLSVLVNGGAGNRVTHNLIVKGGQGISQRATDDQTATLAGYDNGTSKRGGKGDYIWNTEQQLGAANYSAIFDSVLAKRFPSFGRLLSENSTAAGWASAGSSDFRFNTFLNNTQGNVCFEIDAPQTGAHTWLCTNATSNAPLVR